MESEELVRAYPRVYHLAAAGSWASILRHGLLSTATLADLFEVDPKARERLVSFRRNTSVALRHPIQGRAVIRDQAPLSESKLQTCLTDMSVREWLHLLNNRVFFWLTEHKLGSLLDAKLYRERSHCLLTIDTEALVASLGDSIRLSAINSGATLYDPQPRGSDTFKTIADYDFASWKAKRGVRSAIAELAVLGGVQQIDAVMLTAEEVLPGGARKLLWER